MQHAGGLILLPPNTFIGGAGASYITTPSAFVAITNGLTVADINNFQITSNNVSFNVAVEYSFTSNAFWIVNELTYFLDIGSKVLGTFGGLANGVFRSTNLKYLYLPNFSLPPPGRSVAQQCTNLIKSNLGVLFTGNYATGRMFSLSMMKKIILNSSYLNQGNAAFYSHDAMSFAERLYIPNLTGGNTSVIHSAMDRAVARTFQSIKNGCKVYHDSAMGVMDRTSFLILNSSGLFDIGNSFTFNGLVYTAVDGAPTAQGEFNTNVVNNGIRANNVAIAMNTDTRVGTIHPKPYTVERVNAILVKATSVGVAVTSGITWDFPVNTMATFAHTPTFVGGNDVHPVLMDLRDTGLANLIQLSAPISVNAPTGLSYSGHSAYSVVLHFTVPTPNANGTECFEVWVDDGTLWRKLFEFKEISGTGAILYLNEVVTDVGTIVGTKVKIRTMDGHMNYSAFSNEITIAPSASIYDNLYLSFGLRDVRNLGVPMAEIRNTLNGSVANYTAAEIEAGLTAIGTNSGWVTKLYDPIGLSGKGHLVQADTTKQVQIKNAGNMYLNNGKPYINFDNTDRFLLSQFSAASFFNANNLYTVYTVFKSQPTVAPDGLFEEYNPGGVTQHVTIYTDTSSSAYNTSVSATGAQNVLNNLAALPINTLCLQTYRRSAPTTADAYLNGVLQESFGWNNSFSTDTVWALGRMIALNQRFGGQFAEILIFNEAHDDTQRAAIEADVMAYYGI